MRLWGRLWWRRWFIVAPVKHYNSIQIQSLAHISGKCVVWVCMCACACVCTLVPHHHHHRMNICSTRAGTDNVTKGVTMINVQCYASGTIATRSDYPSVPVPHPSQWCSGVVLVVQPLLHTLLPRLGGVSRTNPPPPPPTLFDLWPARAGAGKIPFEALSHAQDWYNGERGEVPKW